jgi:hypothetical protein
MQDSLESWGVISKYLDRVREATIPSEFLAIDEDLGERCQWCG